MAAVAGHFLVIVGQVRRRHAGAPGEAGLSGPRHRHQLGPRRRRIELGTVPVDGVAHQIDLPLQGRIYNRALDQHTPVVALDPLEAALAVGVAQQGQVRAMGRCRRPRGAQGRQAARGTVAVLAANLNGRRHLAHDQARAVAVLREMAVGALQALLGVDVHHVDGPARVGARRDELALPFPAPALGIVGRNDGPVGVQQIALAVALEHAAEIPAVAVIVGELGVAQGRVQIVDRAQEVQIGPVAARRGTLGIAVQHRADFLSGRIALTLGPHGRCVRLIVPHRVAEVAVQEHVRLVHVAVHALGCRDGAGKGVADRVA